MPATVAPAIPTPCINLCEMDGRRGWCGGCGRTIDEIAVWGSGTAAWRATVMQALPARLAQMAARPRG